MASLQGRAAEDFLPRDLHVIECESLLLLDLRELDGQASVGLSEAELTGDSRTRCQAVGEAAHLLDLDGIVAPSAAQRDGVAFALFMDKAATESVTLVATTDFDPEM